MTDRTEILEEDAWHAWDEDTAEQGWLLSYVDVLSVILAMLLVLLVSSLQSQSEPGEPATAEAPAPAVVSAAEVVQLAPQIAPAFSTLSASLPPPPRAPIPRPATMIQPGEPTQNVTAMMPLPMSTQSAILDPQVDGVEVLRHEDAVTLQIAEVVLFDSSRAMLKSTAAPVLERAIMLLNEFGDAIVAVQGHTDNQPVRGGEYGSNWELAAARANAVAAFLLQRGFPPERLRVESYADTRPVAENDSRTGRAQNRRVELRVELPPVTETIAAR
jgi:chemotaxis protein MotB